jgi:hypothetical protein
MNLRSFSRVGHRIRYRVLDVYHHPILLVIIVSLLPTTVLLIISYFQSIAYAKANLEGIIKTATAYIVTE